MARHLVFVLSADVYCSLSAVFSRLCLRTSWVRRSTLYKKLSMHATARNRSHCYYVESLLWCTSGISLKNLTKTFRHVVGYVKPFANFFSSVQLIHIVLLSIFDNRSESSYKGLSLSASRSTCPYAVVPQSGWFAWPLKQLCSSVPYVATKPQGQQWPPQVISTGRCQHIWPTYAVIGWLTKTRTDALLWLV